MAIGKELGILESDERAWEGNAFFADDSAEAEGVRKELLAPSKGDGVFCRTAPADKQRIIKLLADAHGDVTAMTVLTQCEFQPFPNFTVTPSTRPRVVLSS